MNTINIIAWIYLIVFALCILIEPFLFGEDRKPYNPTHWLLEIIAYIPLIYLLLKTITNK